MVSSAMLQTAVSKIDAAQRSVELHMQLLQVCVSLTTEYSYGIFARAVSLAKNSDIFISTPSSLSSVSPASSGS